MDTERRRKELRGVDPKIRLAFAWLWENCDAAGVWSIDHDLFKFECGYKLDIEALLKTCGWIKTLPNGSLFLLDFVPVNYGVLKPGYNPHKPVFRSLEANGIEPLTLLFQDLPKTCQSLEEEDEDNTQGRVERAKTDDGFEDFYSKYPNKKARGAAERAWSKMTKEDRALCRPAIEAQVMASHFRGTDGKDYIPHPATWLNERRWHDEVSATAASLAPAAPLTKEQARARLEDIRKANGIEPGGVVPVSLMPKEVREIIWR